MVEKSQGTAAEGDNVAPVAPGTPRRPGHRGMDPRETVAELTAKAHEISQSAGSKVAAAMKDVIGAAAGLTGFAVESARDLIQYMVRRGQMTQVEGDKLLREVEAAHGTRKPSLRADESARAAARGTTPSVSDGQNRSAAPKAADRKQPKTTEPTAAKASKKSAAPAAEKPAKSTDRTPSREKPSSKKPAEKSAAPAAAKTAGKDSEKGSAKKSAAKGSAARAETPARPKAASKSAPAKKGKK